MKEKSICRTVIACEKPSFNNWSFALFGKINQKINKRQRAHEIDSMLLGNKIKIEAKKRIV